MGKDNKRVPVICACGCGRTFIPKVRGRPQRFYSAQCRNKFNFTKWKRMSSCTRVYKKEKVWYCRKCKKVIKQKTGKGRPFWFCEDCK
jgi:formamidopyrimidine-DNA glycosylase